MKKLIALLVVVFAAFVLVACAPSTYEKAKAKMEDANYICTGSVNKEVGDNGEVATLTGTINLKENFVAVLYDSTANAKKAFNDSKDAEGKVPENLERVGKWVIYGSEGAVKTFKK